MSAFNGKWTLKEAENVSDFMNAINSPGEYKDKLASVFESVNAGSTTYDEEFVFDQEANTIQCILFVNGTQVKDFGTKECDVEMDHVSNDGRPAKLKIVVKSDSKITICEKGEDFTITTNMVISGDSLTTTSNGNGVISTMKYQRYVQ